jgi:hypothetical protein
MYLSARQVQEMMRSAGRIVLPVGARLTPSAADWVRQGGHTFVRSEAEVTPQMTEQNALGKEALIKSSSAPLLWWTATPSATLKAAISTLGARTSAIDILSDPGKLTSVIRQVCKQMALGLAQGAVIGTSASGAAVVLANRRPLLRAIVATRAVTLQASISSAAANVLIIEPDGHSLIELRSLIRQFADFARPSDQAISRQIVEVSRCE